MDIKIFNEEEMEMFIERFSISNTDGNTSVEEALKIATAQVQTHRSEKIINTLMNKIEVEPSKILTLKNLLNKELQPLNWVLPGLICEGVTILASKPKLGKSWFALQLSLAVATAQPFLNYKNSTPQKVLYIPLEDSERRLQNRFVIISNNWIFLNETIKDNLIFPEELNIKPLNGGGLDELYDYIKDFGIGLIIIDTFGKAVKFQSKSIIRQYNEDYNIIGAIQKFASENHVAIILVHHTTKLNPSDNVFDGIQGSTGILAGADTLMVLKKDTIDYTLHITGKDVIADDLNLEFDKKSCLWKLKDMSIDAGTPERNEICYVLLQANCEMRTSEIALALGKKENNISTLLKKMTEEGIIKNPKYGFYCIPKESESVESVES